MLAQSIAAQLFALESQLDAIVAAVEAVREQIKAAKVGADELAKRERIYTVQREQAEREEREERERQAREGPRKPPVFGDKHSSRPASPPPSFQNTPTAQGVHPHPPAVGVPELPGATRSPTAEESIDNDREHRSTGGSAEHRAGGGADALISRERIADSGSA